MNGTIAIINRGEHCDELVDWLWQQPRDVHVVRPRGREIARQRNRAIDEMRGDFVLFVDSNCVPPVDALDRLLACDADIVGGVIVESRPPWEVCAVRSERPWRRFTAADVDDGVEYDAVALGTGCLLVHQHVFVPMERPYFRVGQRDAELLTEDTDFCLLARARGFRLTLHGGVRVGHVIRGLVFASDDAYHVRWPEMAYTEPIENYAA